MEKLFRDSFRLMQAEAFCSGFFIVLFRRTMISAPSIDVRVTLEAIEIQKAARRRPRLCSQIGLQGGIPGVSFPLLISELSVTSFNQKAHICAMQ